MNVTTSKAMVLSWVAWCSACPLACTKSQQGEPIPQSSPVASIPAGSVPEDRTEYAFSKLRDQFPSTSLPFKLSGEELLKQWDSLPSIDEHRSERYLVPLLDKYDAENDGDDVFNFPDFHTSEYRAVAALPAACDCIVLVFAVGKDDAHYGGLATFEQSGRAVEQVSVLAVEGGTGARYLRNMAVATDGTIAVTTVIDVGTQGPTSKVVNYRLSRKGNIERLTSPP